MQFPKNSETKLKRNIIKLRNQRVPGAKNHNHPLCATEYAEYLLFYRSKTVRVSSP